MPDKAHVTSVEALDAFRARLILYVSKARPALEEVSAEVLRVKLWLENDQRLHWEGEVRRCSRTLEQTRQAVSSARMSSLGQAGSADLMAFRRAKKAFEEAEAKLKRLKYWNREFENQADPLVRQLQKLHTFLAQDMPKAAAHIAQLTGTLADYAGLAPVSSLAPGPTDPGKESGEAPSAKESAEVTKQ